MARIITVTSGKGGVGKTSISLNLSLALAQDGYKVCLFDADLGLANVNILTGIYPEKDLVSVMSGRNSLEDIMIRDYQGIDIIPGSSGVEKIADLTRAQTDFLINAFLDLDDYDFFIFDTSAGISAQVVSFCMASHEIVLVATCEPTSLTDAYSMLKVLSKYGYKNPVRVLINQVTNGKSAQKAYAQLKQTAARFLTVRLQPLGIMTTDKNVRAAVISQTPFVLLFPDTLASRCVKSIKEKLLIRGEKGSDIPLELFWDNALTFLDTHYKSKKQEKAEPGVKQKAQGITPELQKALSQIDARILSLTREVREIKQLVAGQKTTMPPPMTAVSEIPKKEPGQATPVLLDFEEWYEKRKAKN